MRCRFPVRLTLVLAVMIGLAVPLLGQTIALATRGPRFLAVPRTGGAPVDASNAQVLQRRVSLSLTRVTVEAALEEIGRQAGVEIMYSKGLLPAGRTVSVEAKSFTVAAALTETLLGSGLDVLLLPEGQMALIRKAGESRAAQLQGGAVVGRVIDGKTGSALAGAAVVVESTSKSATTGSDGRYRIADVTPGTYTVRARYIGYAPGTASVTVNADQEATADFGLEKSAQRLDEVVTTGTVVPTEVKAVPTPISVVTADEIEQKGYQKVEQIFRGDIPGAMAWDKSALSYNSEVNIRGASSISTIGSIKTYIDGVEMADPHYIATIDPSSIERIEILRGPQGSTMYGSEALAGVMQIFTKKGAFDSPLPRVEAKISAGLVESPWVNKATVQQDHSLTVTGGGPGFSYRLGGGYLRQGEWVPEFHARSASLNGGARLTQGPLTLELSARYYDRDLASALDPRLRDAGYTPWSKPIDEAIGVRQQTYGLTVHYAATPRWDHTLVLGYDRTAYDQHNNHARFTTPADSLLFVFSIDNNKPSVAYHTTYTVPAGTAVQSSITAGADYWTFSKGGFSASGATDINTIVSPDLAFRSQYSNSGYFAQEQLGLWDAVFVTAGIRVEDIQTLGKDFGLVWAPRVGLSYVRTIGSLTAKARMAYGKAVRPPLPGISDGLVTPFEHELANPDLAPEKQVGLDGGLELYFGSRASLEANYYHQTAEDLIDIVILGFTPVFTYQFQNAGKVKNTGWEFQGHLNQGRLALTGTYSITKSVVEGLSPVYGGNLRPGDQILGIPKGTAGATLTYSLPRTKVTLGMTHVGSWTQTDNLALYASYYGGQTYRGTVRDYWMSYPGFTKFRLALSQTVTNHTSAFLQSDNLANSHAFERDNLNLSPGRSTLIGVRTDF